MNHHPAIISDEAFERVQKEKARRSNIEETETGYQRRKRTTRPSVIWEGKTVAENVVTIPALNMDRIDHKRVAAYICFDPGDTAGLRDHSVEMNYVVKEIYLKPKWKLAQLYWDYEPCAPVTERRAYKDFRD